MIVMSSCCGAVPPRGRIEGEKCKRIGGVVSVGLLLQTGHQRGPVSDAVSRQTHADACGLARSQQQKSDPGPQFRNRVVIGVYPGGTEDKSNSTDARRTSDSRSTSSARRSELWSAVPR